MIYGSLFIVLWSSCENSGTIGFDDGDDVPGVLMTDTITVEASSVYAGPVPTSGTGELLAGSYHDRRLGKISARSFFSISPESADFAFNKEVVFDSVALIIRCSGYYYGDTTAYQTLRVFELQERPEAEELPPNPEGVPGSYLLNGNELYSSSHADYDRTDPLATVRVRPRPSSDTLHIRLPDALGEEWMRLSEEGDDRIASAEGFADYFNGLVISGDPEDGPADGEMDGPADGSPDDGAVISYRADTAFVRLYYRETEDDGTISDKYTDFFIYQPELQFNEVVAERTGTPLEGFGPGSPLPAAAAGEETYLQAGTGIMTRLSFPYLKEFLEAAGDSSLSVHSAQLLVRPVTETITAEEYLPRTLILFYTNENNTPLYPLQDATTGGPHIATFNYDREFPDKTWYKFALTDYFSNLLNDYDGTEASLLLSQLPADLSATVTRLCLGSGRHPKNKLQLILYYTPAR